MSTDLMARPEVREVREETSVILSSARTFKIATNVSYQLAGEELKRIKGIAKRLDEVRKTITQPMDAAKKAVLDFFRRPEEELAEAEQQLKNAMNTYRAQLEEKEAQARAAAEKAANEERERLALAAARAAEEGRQEDAQEAVATMASVAPAPVIMRQTPKITGIHTVVDWQYEIVDAKQIPDEYKLIDQVAIRKVVKAMKERTNIPGVRVFSKEVIASRAS